MTCMNGALLPVFLDERYVHAWNARMYICVRVCNLYTYHVFACCIYVCVHVHTLNLHLQSSAYPWTIE